MAMNIVLQKKQNAPKSLPFEVKTHYDGRTGFFAAVTELHPENNTVHVTTDTGIELMNVKVASQAWVTYIKDGKPQLTGERSLPPVGTYVYCVMPDGHYEESFVLCSLFSEASIHADYMEEGEDAANTKKTVENGGWNKTTDFRTGTKVIKNKTEDETISLEIDQEEEGKENVKLTAQGTVITIDKENGISITTDKKIEITDKEGFTYSTEGNIELKSTKTGTLELGNTIDTLGAMISSLLEYLSSSEPVTYGSPASHMFMPTFVAKITALKTKWEKVFK